MTSKHLNGAQVSTAFKQDEVAKQCAGYGMNALALKAGRVRRPADSAARELVETGEFAVCHDCRETASPGGLAPKPAPVGCAMHQQLGRA